LGERPARVVDVAEQVGERERVEGLVREGQTLGARLDELDIRQPLARDREHLRALVEADHSAALLPDQFRDDQAGSGGNVEGAVAFRCAYRGEDGERSWLVLDGEGKPVTDRARVREVVSIAALVEVAEETAGGDGLDELRSRLVALRLTENPPGIDEAEEAALALEATIGGTPRAATPDRLDAIG